MLRMASLRLLRFVRLACAYNFFLLLGACASAPPPTDEVASARALVAQAHPIARKDAPLELQAAEAKLARAEHALQNGRNETARRFAEEAELDARLAWITAENARVQRA